jgi:hypothetical protein
MTLVKRSRSPGLATRGFLLLCSSVHFTCTSDTPDMWKW